MLENLGSSGGGQTVGSLRRRVWAGRDEKGPGLEQTEGRVRVKVEANRTERVSWR